MGLLDKFKNLFTDEVEEDDEPVVETPVKSEVMHVEIPGPAPKKEAEPVIEQTRTPLPKVPERRPAPVLFEDKDFDIVDYKETEPPIEIMPTYESKYSIKKTKPEPEVKQTFRPTPIISPIYGVLDKNYKKEDITSRRNSVSDYNKTSLDEVREKAYGSLEEELAGLNFDLPTEKKEETRSLLEEDLLPRMDVKERRSRVEENKKITSEPDLSDLTENKETSLESDIENSTSTDLFNLIDQMYERED